jgi:hypothetical protein
VSQTPLATPRASSSSPPMEVGHTTDSLTPSLRDPTVSALPPEVASGTETTAQPDPPTMKSPGGTQTPSREAASDIPSPAPPQSVVAKSILAEASLSLASGGQDQTQVPVQNSDAPQGRSRRFSLRHLAVLVLLIFAAIASVFCFFMYAKSRARPRPRTPLVPREMASRPQSEPGPAAEEAPAENQRESHSLRGTQSPSTAATPEPASHPSDSDSPHHAESVTTEQGAQDAPTLPNSSGDSPASSPPKPGPGRT